MDIKVADEVWIGTALLHYEKPSAKSFSNNQILYRIKQENIFGAIRPDIQTHIISHCVANKPAQPNRCRMLYSLRDGTKRLFRDTDNCDLSRVNGKTKPNEEDVPEKYRYLLNWYNGEYNRIDLRESTTLKHNERCPKCKENIKAILQNIYGKVEQNYKFQIGTLPSNFKGNKYFESLRKIFEALQEHRGFKDFVKVKTLPVVIFLFQIQALLLSLMSLNISHRLENVHLNFIPKN